jgi:hypothetical protein
MPSQIQPLFDLGRLVATPGALEAMRAHEIEPALLLARHQMGDWGHGGDEDTQSNNNAVQQGLRILSAYSIDPAKPCNGHSENTLWVITEADRSSTTILLPEEYSARSPLASTVVLAE